MPENILHSIIYSLSYPEVFLLTLLYFSLLYFGLAPLVHAVCKKMEKAGMVQKINAGPLVPGQIRLEVKNSFISIMIFGLSGLPLIYLVRHGAIQLLPDTPLLVCYGLLIITLWNEVHFFIIHRLLHLPLLMRTIHHVHHRSKVPTVYSVYSFHWVEAALLSTVPLIIAPVVPVAPLAILLFPLVSVSINYVAHCNYRFARISTRGFATNHNQHHRAGKKNYGFALSVFDRVLSENESTKNQPLNK